MKVYRTVATKTKSESLPGAHVGSPVPTSKFELISLLQPRSVQSEKKYGKKREEKDKMYPPLQKKDTYMQANVHTKSLQFFCSLLFQNNKTCVKYIQRTFRIYPATKRRCSNGETKKQTNKKNSIEPLPLTNHLWLLLHMLFCVAFKTKL